MLFIEYNSIHVDEDYGFLAGLLVAMLRLDRTLVAKSALFNHFVVKDPFHQSLAVVFKRDNSKAH